MLHCIQVFGPFHNARISQYTCQSNPDSKSQSKCPSVGLSIYFSATRFFTHPIFLENRNNLLKCAIIDCNTVNEAKTVRIILTSIKVSIWYDPSYSLAQPELS